MNNCIQNVYNVGILLLDDVKDEIIFMDAIIDTVRDVFDCAG